MHGVVFAIVLNHWSALRVRPSDAVGITISYNNRDFFRLYMVVISVDCYLTQFAGKLQLAIVSIQNNYIAIAMAL